jgi:hypothetical protein
LVERRTSLLVSRELVLIMSAEDLAFDMLSGDAEAGFATDEGLRARLRRWAIISRIIGMLNPSTMPAVEPPQPPPPISDTAPTAGASPPSRRRRSPQQAEAMLEHMGRIAAGAESDERARSALGAALPLMQQLAGPVAGPAVRRAAPRVRRAVVNAGSQLRRLPATRNLAAILPLALARVGRQLRRAARAGRTPTAQQVMRLVAAELGSMLANPAAARRLTGHPHANACPMCRRRGAAHGAGCGCEAHAL